MAAGEQHGTFGDVVEKFALAKSAVIRPDYDNAVMNQETLRQLLVQKYAAEVYLPRLVFWEDFDSFFKNSTPTTVNPRILEPAKRHGLDENRENIYTHQLQVAAWQFERTLPEQQVTVASTVTGFEIGNIEKKSLRKDYPHVGLGKLALGKGKEVRKAYLDSRIAAINGYTIQTEITNLEATERKVIDFRGQSHTYDTFVTMQHLRDAGRTYTATQLDQNGQGFRTRPLEYGDVFSAPIETPIELSAAQFIPKYIPGEDKSIDVGGSFKNYAYLFDESASAQFYGQIDVTDGNKYLDLLGGGNETLAYRQAEALFSYIQESSLVGA